MAENNSKKTGTTGNSDTVNVSVQVVQPAEDKVLVVGKMKTKVPKLLANDKSRAKERKAKEIKKAEPTARKVTEKMQDRG